MTRKDTTTPYDAFEADEVAEAELDMKRDRLARDLSRPLTDEDVLIWIRSRRAQPSVGNVTLDQRGDRVCILANDGATIWLSRLAAVDLCRDLMRLLIEKT